MIKAALFSVFFLASLQANAAAAVDMAKEGLVFQRSLIAAIEGADRIIVREHSDPMDTYAGEETRPTAPEKTYAHKDLNAAEKQRFVSLIRAMSPVTQEAFPACVPEYHHTIKFIDKARRVLTMKICFGCGQVDFDGTQAAPPARIYTTLGAFVRGLGMSPERNWEKLARSAPPARSH